MNKFDKQADIYYQLASTVYQKPIEEVSLEERYNAKDMYYSWCYSGTPLLEYPKELQNAIKAANDNRPNSIQGGDGVHLSDWGNFTRNKRG